MNNYVSILLDIAHLSILMGEASILADLRPESPLQLLFDDMLTSKVINLPGSSLAEDKGFPQPWVPFQKN